MAAQPKPTTIIVAGAGVIGLTTAVRLRQLGYDAHIIARDTPPNTTSDAAAAIWFPYRAEPQDLVLQWSKATFEQLAQLTHEPAAAVRWIEMLMAYPKPIADPWWTQAVPHIDRIQDPTLLPPGYSYGLRARVPMLHAPRYLQYLRTTFERSGGTIVRRAITSFAPWTTEGITVFNCTGLGARELLNDQELFPIRGQVIRARTLTPIEQSTAIDEGPLALSYIIPREDDIILGGTEQDGDDRRTIDKTDAAAILSKTTQVEPRLSNAQIIEHIVGLRPGRSRIRLAAEPAAPGLVIHNYGHGGAGFTLSWGCADAAITCMNQHQ